MDGDKAHPFRCLYRTSLERMDTHLMDDACEQILPEGVPDTAAVAMYRELAKDARRVQGQFDDIRVRSSSERPAGYRTAPANVDDVKKKEARRTLWDILNTPLQHLFGGQYGK